MTTTLVPAAPATADIRRRGAGFVSSTSAMATRTLRKFRRTPQLIVVSTVQGAMFLLIFRYVFGGAIGSGGVHYVDFLVPGFVVTGVLFSGMGAAAGVAEDVEQGFLDRLRSLPVPRSSIPVGRVIADSLLSGWGLLITTAIGFFVGFRLHASVAAGLAALALTFIYGFAFAWVFAFIGLMAGSAQAAQGLSLLVFPFTFVSSAYVPVATMPAWMQPIAEHQPITVMTDAVRGLTQGESAEALMGHSAAHDVVLSLVWSAAIIAVFAPLAFRRYSRG
jgi:ABC-2 type transport system permease protein